MRRSVLLAAAVLAGLWCSAARADWPQFLGPDRTGVSTEKNLARSLTDGTVQPLWSVKLGPGFGSAAVQGGQVFVLDREGDIAPNRPARGDKAGKDPAATRPAKPGTDVLRCLDLDSGKELWTFSYEAPGKSDYPGSRSVPAVDEKYVFTFGPYGHFHCIDRTTHQAVWSKNILKEYQGGAPGWGCGQSPLLYKDMVIVAALGQRAGVVAFEKATGKTVWQSKGIGGMGYASPMIVRIGDVEQVVIVNNDTVAGVDASNGEVLWTYKGWKCDIAIPNVTAIGDGRLFVTGGYKAGSAMIKVESQDGKFTAREVFKVKEYGAQIHNAILINDHLYLNGNTNDAADGLMCVDLDGKIVWQTKKSPNMERGSFIYADGLIYMLDGKSGFLRIIEPSPGGYKELSSAKMMSANMTWAPMALSDGKLIMRDQSQLKCITVRAKE